MVKIADFLTKNSKFSKQEVTIPTTHCFWKNKDGNQERIPCNPNPCSRKIIFPLNCRKQMAFLYLKLQKCKNNPKCKREKYDKLNKKLNKYIETYSDNVNPITIENIEQIPIPEIIRKKTDNQIKWESLPADSRPNYKKWMKSTRHERRANPQPQPQ